jgi:hypothetical protein
MIHPFNDRAMIVCSVEYKQVPDNHFCGYGERREASG